MDNHVIVVVMWLVTTAGCSVARDTSIPPYEPGPDVPMDAEVSLPADDAGVDADGAPLDGSMRVDAKPFDPYAVPEIEEPMRPLSVDPASLPACAALPCPTCDVCACDDCLLGECKSDQEAMAAVLDAPGAVVGRAPGGGAVVGWLSDGVLRYLTWLPGQSSWPQPQSLAVPELVGGTLWTLTLNDVGGLAAGVSTTDAVFFLYSTADGVTLEPLLYDGDVTEMRVGSGDHGKSAFWLRSKHPGLVTSVVSVAEGDRWRPLLTEPGEWPPVFDTSGWMYWVSSTTEPIVTPDGDLGIGRSTFDHREFVRVPAEPDFDAAWGQVWVTHDRAGFVAGEPALDADCNPGPEAAGGGVESTWFGYQVGNTSVFEKTRWRTTNLTTWLPSWDAARDVFQMSVSLDDHALVTWADGEDADARVWVMRADAEQGWRAPERLATGDGGRPYGAVAEDGLEVWLDPERTTVLWRSRDGATVTRSLPAGDWSAVEPHVVADGTLLLTSPAGVFAIEAVTP